MLHYTTYDCRLTDYRGGEERERRDRRKESRGIFVGILSRIYLRQGKERKGKEKGRPARKKVVLLNRVSIRISFSYFQLRKRSKNHDKN